MTLSNGKPFLRWAGGKTWLLPTIDKLIPQKYSSYHEPFLGGGSVFFYLNPINKSYLSDTNNQLINSYVQVRDNIEKLLSILTTFENNSESYYRIRGTTYEDKIHQAAQFIYLNRTGFNGIYRVNLEGKYNVPYGHKDYRVLYNLDLYRSVSKALEGTEIFTEDFDFGVSRICEGDLVFLDPPYTMSGTNNGFIKYNEKLFSWNDQKRLALYISKLVEKGAYYVLTNAKHPDVYNLFSNIDEPISVSRYSVVGGKQARRGRIEEYVFSNIVITKRMLTDG